jgi:CIC family chloride channel protein
MLLGVVCGLTSFYYSRVFLKVENYFRRFERNSFQRVLIGGLLLFVLILLFPPLFGEGYDNIILLSNLEAKNVFANTILPIVNYSRPLLYLLLFAVILLKPVATAATIGGGGNGGNFAPSLFMGAFVGFLFASLLGELNIVQLPISNFTLVAMAGLLSGVFHAPLTGIFIIAEITGGYELVIPLMIVSAMSYAVSKYFMPLSIDFTKLSEKEKINRTSTDEYLLSNLSLRDLVETDFIEVELNDTLRKLVEKVAVSKRNIFPVLDSEGRLSGLVTIDDIRDIMFKQEQYDVLSMQQLMHLPACVINEKDDIRSAMKLFDESHLWNIPVVMEGKYLGFISKSSILEKYREVLIQSSLE